MCMTFGNQDNTGLNISGRKFEKLLKLNRDKSQYNITSNITLKTV